MEYDQQGAEHVQKLLQLQKAVAVFNSAPRAKQDHLLEKRETEIRARFLYRAITAVPKSRPENGHHIFAKSQPSFQVRRFLVR